MKKLIKYLILIASGGLTALSMMYTPLCFLAWFSIAPLAYYLFKETDRKKNPFRIYLTMLVWALSFYIVIFHWFVYMYPMDFLGLDKDQAVWMVAFFWFGLSGVQAACTAIAAPLFRLCARHRFLYAPLFASLYVLFEWFQTLFWTGVPWARLAISQTPATVFIQSASLFGSLFVSFIIVLVNALIAFAFVYFTEKGIRDRGVRIYAIAAAGVFLANLLFGCAALAFHTEDEERRFTAVLVQGNLASAEKWNSDISPLELYTDLTLKAIEEAGGKADIIVWPETSINYYLKQSKRTVEGISKLASDTGAVILVGTFDAEEDEEGNFFEYNAVIAFMPDGSMEETPYYKQHLVPFGEYVPMRELVFKTMPWLDDLNLFGSDLTPGSEPRPAVTDLGRIGRLVCFDSIYSDLARVSVGNGAELLSLSTNDSWFRDSTAVYQHNRHAVLRSVENGRWMLRAANTGISTIISSTGAVTKSLDPLVTGYVIGDAYFSSSRTLYSYIGDLFVLTCFMFAATEGVFVIVGKVRSRKTNEKENNP